MQPELFGPGTPRPPAASALKTVTLNNRKYLGSKHRLLDFLERAIMERCPKIRVFADLFAGTGVVAGRMAPRTGHLVLNDILYSNYVINRAFFCTTADNTRMEYVAQTILELNALPPAHGYAAEQYAGTYFTLENARRIDSVREDIERRRAAGECSEQEGYLLVASLLFAVDKVANTVGQYDAYLKNIDAAGSMQGRHVVDANVRTTLSLRLPRVDYRGEATVLQGDAQEAVRGLDADVLYLDPPYNGRQYVDCYHVLENIARWDKPPLSGKTRKFPRAPFKSAFSRTAFARAAFAELFRASRARWIFVSYNNEGLLALDELHELLSARGRTEHVDASYAVFGNGAGVSTKRKTVERLFCCKVDGHP